MGTLIRYKANDADAALRTATAVEGLLDIAESEPQSFQTTSFATDGKQYRYVVEKTSGGTQIERWVEVGNPTNILTARPTGWGAKANNLSTGASIGTIRYRAVADVGSEVSINDIIHVTWTLNGANEPTRVIVNATKSTTLTSMPVSAALVEATVPSSVLSVGQTWTDGAPTPSFYVLRDTGTQQQFVRVKGPGANTLADASTLTLVTGSTTVNSTFPAETTALYRARATGTGYALDDVIMRVLWVDRTTPNVVAGSFWFNVTSGQALTVTPPISNLNVLSGSGGGSGTGGEVTIALGGSAIGPSNPLPVAPTNLRVASADVAVANPVPTALVLGGAAVASANPIPVVEDVRVKTPTTEINATITSAVTGGFLYTIAADPQRRRGFVVNNSQVTLVGRESMTPANVATADTGAPFPPGATWVLDTPGTVSFFSPVNTAKLWGLLWSGA